METKQVVAALAALAQDTRLAIFRRLVQAGMKGVSVGDIGAQVSAAPATLSFHLKEMVHAGLIDSRQEGRFIFYFANYARMNELLSYLTDNCCADDNTDCGPACNTECAPTRPAKPAKAKPASRPRLTKRRASAR
jgi:ArsR family transcriptional regulator